FGSVLAPAMAEDPEISSRRTEQETSFTDAQIVDGFFKVTFGAELHPDGRIDRIRKYDGPVRVYIENRAQPDRSAEITQVIAEIGKRVAHLDIGVTARREAANMTVSLIRDRDLEQTIRTIYGREQALKIQNSLEPQCLSSFRKDRSFRILRSDVILVVDAGDFVFYDCAYEELLQALGPINDDSSIPWTMFNDDVQLGFFGLYDQYLLNLLYDPRIRPGMTREETRIAVTQILPDVRAFVAQTNGMAR
ncbi:MAG: DUF2927 domain-containing protein, partial [Bradyrhizobium sp.]